MISHVGIIIKKFNRKVPVALIAPPLLCLIVIDYANGKYNRQ